MCFWKKKRSGNCGSRNHLMKPFTTVGVTGRYSPWVYSRKAVPGSPYSAVNDVCLRITQLYFCCFFYSPRLLKMLLLLSIWSHCCSGNPVSLSCTHQLVSHHQSLQVQVLILKEIKSCLNLIWWSKILRTARKWRIPSPSKYIGILRISI